MVVVVVVVAGASAAAAAASSARMTAAAAASAAAAATKAGSPSSSSAAETMRREPRLPPGTERLRWRKATLARGGIVATAAARGRAPAGLEAALTRPVSATLDTREAMSGGGVGVRGAARVNACDAVLPINLAG